MKNTLRPAAPFKHQGFFWRPLKVFLTLWTSNWHLINDRCLLLRWNLFPTVDVRMMLKTTLFANLVKRKTNYIRTFPRDAKFINFVFVCLLFFYKKNTQKTMPLNYCLLIFNRDLSQSYEKPQSNMHYKKKARFKFQFENNKAARFLFHWESRVDLKWVVGTNWELWWDFIRNLLNFLL